MRAFALAAGEPVASDARAVWRDWHSRGGELEALQAPGVLDAALADRPVIIDGLFGIGLKRPLEGVAATVVLALNRANADVIAVDVPSGLDADTGAVVGGANGVAVRARLTVTMIADKPGLHTAAALDHAGHVQVAALGRASAMPPVWPDPDGTLLREPEALALRPSRARDSNKGSFGSVLVMGGAQGTQGAALLAARGAQAVGAGKVFVCSPDGRVFDPGQPHLMTRAADAPLDGIDAICVGCGLGRAQGATALLSAALRSDRALVIDADALNLLAEESAFARRLAARTAPAVLTPHPLEAARLLGISARQVQADRIGHACALAARLRATVVLKGAGTVIASPQGAWSIIDSGGPALATAGTGDVLAGMVAAFLAQGASPSDAARLGAWLHGRAGDLWQRQHPFGAGLSASLLPAHVVDAINTSDSAASGGDQP